MTSAPTTPSSTSPAAPAADRALARPLLIFDGDCGFCRRSVGWIQKITGERADYAPSQEVGAAFPSIPAGDFAREVKLVGTDGQVSGGAEAVFRLLSAAGNRRWTGLPLRAYQSLPGFRSISEAAYRFVATQRMFFSWLTRWL